MYFPIFFVLFFVSYSQQKPTVDAKQHLHEYGYLKSTNANLLEVESALKQFQKMHNFEKTGKINEETMNKMNTPRCGKPDNVPEFAHQEETKWPKRHLTYKIYNFTDPSLQSQIKQNFKNFINLWTNDVWLDIEETDSDLANISVFFKNIDGPGSLLGYAYYPNNGSIYLDIDEDYSFGKSRPNNGILFNWVGAHELGHALGLSHSKQDSESIMYPYYLTSSATEPTEKDIQRLKEKYGKRILNNTILCSGVPIDAMLKIKPRILIVGKQFWSFTSGTSGMIESGPFPLTKQFKNPPEKIDAAFVVNKKSYFVSNYFYQKFDHNAMNITLARHISTMLDGIPASVDASFYDKMSEMIYFFKGSKYYTLDINAVPGKRLKINGEKIKTFCKGLPNNIEAVTVLKDSRALFIKKSKCYFVDTQTKELIETKKCSSLYRCKTRS